MAVHPLDHGNPIWPDPIGGDHSDITDQTERYAFFEREAEAALNGVRLERNRKIAVTDWTQNPDVPQSTRDKWVTYRQELRDVPATYKNLGDVIWPTPPS